MFETPIGDDHGRAGGHHRRGSTRGCLSARYDRYNLVRHAFLRWHYPDQVRGSAARSSALSARLPELPVYVPDIVAAPVSVRAARSSCRAVSRLTTWIARIAAAASTASDVMSTQSAVRISSAVSVSNSVRSTTFPA